MNGKPVVSGRALKSVLILSLFPAEHVVVKDCHFDLCSSGFSQRELAPLRHKELKLRPLLYSPVQSLNPDTFNIIWKTWKLGCSKCSCPNNFLFQSWQSQKQTSLVHLVRAYYSSTFFPIHLDIFIPCERTGIDCLQLYSPRFLSQIIWKAQKTQGCKKAPLFHTESAAPFLPPTPLGFQEWLSQPAREL